MVGRDREDALAKAVQAASPWYINMAKTGHNKYVDPEGLIASIPGVLASHWVLGDAEDCARQLREIGAAVPVNPVITRANWPGMSPDESAAYIERLGEELIPELKDFESVTSLSPALMSDRASRVTEFWHGGWGSGPARTRWSWSKTARWPA